MAAVGQGPMRWSQLPDIGVVGNGGVLVKYKGIAEAISVDEQPRMEGNDAVCCHYGHGGQSSGRLAFILLCDGE